MTTFAPVRLAHALWLQQDDQLYIEVDDLTSLPVSDHSPVGAWTSRKGGASATGRTTPTNNGDRRNPSLGKRGGRPRR